MLFWPLAQCKGFSFQSASISYSGCSSPDAGLIFCFLAETVRQSSCDTPSKGILGWEAENAYQARSGCLVGKLLYKQETGFAEGLQREPGCRVSFHHPDAVIPKCWATKEPLMTCARERRKVYCEPKASTCRKVCISV